MIAILTTEGTARLHDGQPTGGGRQGAKPGIAPAQPTGSLLDLILASLHDDKAVDTVVIDLAGKSALADAMVVASGLSARQVGAMADHLVERLKAERIRPVNLEGQAHGDWVLIDAGDVVVHLFRPEVRAFYRIEEMWGVDTPLGRPDLATFVPTPRH